VNLIDAGTISGNKARGLCEMFASRKSRRSIV
jgi:hypothetical protein